jgi:phosphoglycolate phosphatase
MSIKALLFDLDGTLLDTLEDLANAANRVLAQADRPTHSIGAFRHFIGDGARMLITRAIPENDRYPERIEYFLARFKADYGRHWNIATRPYPGIRDLLVELIRRNIPRAVVTNKPHHFAEECMHHFFQDTPFQFIRGQKDNLPLKPDPSPALEAAAFMGVSPGECIMLGDSGVDMQTAVAAGMLPIGATWGFRPADELHQAGAVGIITRPWDVLTWLDRNSTP